MIRNVQKKAFTRNLHDNLTTRSRKHKFVEFIELIYLFDYLMFDGKFSCSRTAISCVNTGKELKHGSELNMNSNYRHLLSIDEQTLMMVKIRKGQVSCHSHASTSKPMSPNLGIFLFDHKSRMLQRFLQRFKFVSKRSFFSRCERKIEKRNETCHVTFAA